MLYFFVKYAIFFLSYTNLIFLFKYSINIFIILFY